MKCVECVFTDNVHWGTCVAKHFHRVAIDFYRDFHGYFPYAMGVRRLGTYKRSVQQFHIGDTWRCRQDTWILLLRVGIPPYWTTDEPLDSFMNIVYNSPTYYLTNTVVNNLYVFGLEEQDFP